ncbi:hypothetical protein KJ682_02355 [bacterium]|nr:hypothetical protein [bacterium]
MSVRLRVVAPSLRDPRVTLLGALSTYTVLGQFVLFFDIRPLELAACLVTSGLLDLVMTVAMKRRLEIPLSGLITGLSIGLLLESYDLRVFFLASGWGVMSKYLVRYEGRHLFNPSNFAVVAALVLAHGSAAVSQGAQWGNHVGFALVILVLGSLMMIRVGRFPVVAGWLAGYVAMGFMRILAGQGGLVFTLGPMTSAEFALFSFSMLPDPKTSPAEVPTQFAWGLGLGLMDGIMRLAGIKYSMFFALFAFCAARPWIEKIGQRLFRPGALLASRS